MLVTNNVGMRTNCMSCHIQANFPNGKTDPNYLGNTYVDYNSPKFRGVLKTDFLWSVADMAKPPAPKKKPSDVAAGSR